MVVGVLALQGDFHEHEEILKKLGAATVRIKTVADLERIDRLIIPGGESTTIGNLLALYHLLEPIKKRVNSDMPLWGTCAGAILMAKHIADGRADQPHLGVMDITARRNAFGRQNDSFETTIFIKEVSERPIPVVCIRAPILESPGKKVRVLARLPNKKIIATQQGKMLATNFHPELTKSTAFHSYFLSL